MSSASWELILLPKPLSVNVKNRFLPNDTIPENPWTDYPFIGKLPPDLRGYLASPTNVTPGILPSASVRGRLLAVNSPEVANNGPASLGAATLLENGKTA